MIMKRFIAAEMRQVMQLVTDELGEDALILSNRRTADGIEVIAAVDYEDELEGALATLPDAADLPVTRARQSQAAPPVAPSVTPVSTAAPAAAADAAPQAGNEQVSRELRALREMLEVPLMRLGWDAQNRRDPVRAAVMQQLDRIRLHPVIANHIADQVQGDVDEESAWRHALEAFAALLPVETDDLLEQGGVVALVGPTGVGKTTTIAKLAAHFALRHGRRHVALVTMDHYRIGAHDQLRTYGKLLGVPVHIAGDEQELEVILRQMDDRRLILIDTAGTSQRDEALVERFAALESAGRKVRRYLVLSATTQLSVCNEVLQAFSCLRPERCILTKLDEAATLGGVMSVLIRHALPLVFVSNGQQVPDDLQEASAQQLIAAALEMAAAGGESQGDAGWLHAMDRKEVALHANAGH